MIIKKHFEKIALVFVISLQGCAIAPVTPEKKEVAFTPAIAAAQRAEIAALERQDRAIANKERQLRVNEEVRIINAKKTDNSTSTNQRPTSTTTTVNHY